MSPVVIPFAGRVAGACSSPPLSNQGSSSEQLETVRREARLLPRGATSCCSLGTHPSPKSKRLAFLLALPPWGNGGACWHDGRPDSPRPSPRCWLRSQMAPTRAFPAWCAESPRRLVPFISRLSPSERIPLDWNPRSWNSGIDSTIPPRRDIDCICRCRDCFATGSSLRKAGYLNR